jgi:WD40 repeat protein/serine/threonine protein kinase
MLESAAEGQILFGLLAIEMRLVSVEGVARAMAKWAAGSGLPLRRILAADGMLDESAAALVQNAVELHLARTQGDPARGLEAIAGSQALCILRGVLEHTVKPPSVPELTIAKVEHHSELQNISGNGYSRPAEPVTEKGDSRGDLSLRTMTFDGLAKESSNFQILRPLASGGLGEVFVARDGRLNREVALKLIQESQSADAQSKARFLLEAEITGGLEHPGIVPVYALGETADGRPFYAMRLVRGETLKERIRKLHGAGSLSQRSREFRKLLNHFVRICDIVAYAHSRGVLHRDLKPSNVMLGKFGETLVVDWGLAKSIERVGAEASPAEDEVTLRPASGSSVQATMHGATLGTPQYMSPEQARGQLDRVATASDVYSLGATLYTILTGRPPLADVSEIGEVLRRVALGDIPPARSLARDVPPTLDLICRKAMALRAEDRHNSPVQLAADVESWLADEPVHGIRESLGPRLGRWERRHRTFIRAGGLGLIAVSIVSIAAAVWVNSARQRAEERRRQAFALREIAETRKIEANRQRDALRQLTTRLTLDRGLSLLENNQQVGLLWLARSLHGASQQNDPFEPAIRANLGAWSKLAHRLRDCLEHQGPVRVVAWSRTGGSVATASDDGTAGLWDPVTGTRLCPPIRHGGPVRSLAYTSDGKFLATGSEDRTARIWNAQSGLARGEPMLHLGPVTSVGFSADDATLITASGDGMVRLWDAGTGQLAGQPLAHGKPLSILRVAPDGKSVASVDEHGSAMIWDLATRSRRALLQGPRGYIQALEYSPDGTMLVFGGEDRRVRLASASAGTVMATSPAGHGGPVLAVAFNREGTLVASGSYDTSCALWRVPDLIPQGAKIQQRGHVWAIAFSPDGTKLAAAADDNTTQVWDVKTLRASGDALPHQKPVRAVTFSSDGRSILTGCDDGAARIWQLGNDSGIGQPMRHTGEVRALAARPDGRMITTVSGDGIIWLWDALTTREITHHKAHDAGAHFVVAYNRAGTILASGGEDRTIRLWSGTTLDPIGPPIRMSAWVRRIVFSPDGSTLAAGDHSGKLGFWDARTARPLAPLAALPHSVTALAFDPEGTRLAVCDSQGEARFWDVTRFQPFGEPIRHRLAIRSVAFDADGTRLATSSYDKTARLWDARTARPMGSPMSGRGYIWSIEFSPDGRRVLTASFDGTAQIWSAETGSPLGEPMNHGDMLYGARFNQAASIVLTFGRSGAARLWDAASSRPLGEWLRHADEIDDGAFLSGRPAVATISRDGTARIWSVPGRLDGGADEIASEMSVLTGMELGNDDVAGVLDVAAWKSRHEAIAARGAPAQP